MEIEIIMIHFSSVEIDINFLLVFSLLGSWLFTWGKGAFCWGIIIKKKSSLVLKGSFLDKGSLPVLEGSFSHKEPLPGGGGGGGLINIMKLVQSSNN